MRQAREKKSLVAQIWMTAKRKNVIELETGEVRERNGGRLA